MMTRYSLVLLRRRVSVPALSESEADRGKNYGWLRAMRQMIQGISLLAIGLGWAFQWPVAIAAGVIFGLEETI